MRNATIENRLRRLEADPRNGRFARLTREELETEIIRRLNTLAEGFPTYDALIDSLAASPDPAEQRGAEHLRDFLADYVARHQPTEPAP